LFGRTFVIQEPPLFVCYPAPLACLRTQTSCTREPNPILAFFHFLSFLSDLSLLREQTNLCRIASICREVCLSRE
jgi:hypothetical protein